MNNTQKTHSPGQYKVNVTCRGFYFTRIESTSPFADFGAHFINDKALDEKCREAFTQKKSVELTAEDIAEILDKKFYNHSSLVKNQSR